MFFLQQTVYNIFKNYFKLVFKKLEKFNIIIEFYKMQIFITLLRTYCDQIKIYQ